MTAFHILAFDTWLRSLFRRSWLTDFVKQWWPTEWWMENLDKMLTILHSLVCNVTSRKMLSTSVVSFIHTGVAVAVWIRRPNMDLQYNNNNKFCIPCIYVVCCVPCVYIMCDLVLPIWRNKLWTLMTFTTAAMDTICLTCCTSRNVIALVYWLLTCMGQWYLVLIRACCHTLSYGCELSTGHTENFRVAKWLVIPRQQ